MFKLSIVLRHDPFSCWRN